MTEPVTFKYRAFISYSHADTSWAEWLHRALESFTIDKELVGRETAAGAIPKTLKPIFRDRDDFTAGHALSDQTLAALDASAALIVICSPAAAKSRYVNEEIRLFKSRHSERPVIPLIVGGKPGDAELECFPPALKFKLDAKGRITKRKVELLAADARDEGDGRELALAKVVAGLLGLSSDDIFRRAERDRRRKGRVRMGIVTVLAFLAFAASGSAVYAWQELKTNEAFLTATLKRATDIVNTAVAQAETYGVPRKATLALLGQAEGMFDDMARLGHPTPELRLRKAWMLIEFARNYAVLGDSGRWQERAAAAQRLLSALAKENPDEIDYQQGLAAADEVLGNVRMAQGNLAEALQSYNASLAIIDHLAKTDLDNVTVWQRDLAVDYSRIGAVLLSQGKQEEALQSYRRAIEFAEAVVKTDPSNTGWLRDLSVAYNQVGQVLLQQGNPEQSLPLFKKSFAIRESLAKLEPENPVRQRDLSTSYQWIGGVFMQQNKFADALDSYQAELAIAERLAKTDPDNSTWQRDLAGAHEKVGDALQADGKLVEALTSFESSLAIADGLARADPENLIWQRASAFSRGRVAGVLAEQGDTSHALAEYRQGRDVIASLLQRSPDNADLSNDLAEYNSEIANIEQANAASTETKAQDASP